MGRESYWVRFGKELVWGAKTPVIAAGVTYGLLKGREYAKEVPWIAADLAEGKAAKVAFQNELLKAYKFTYPDDNNVTPGELTEFWQTARNIDETFRSSNFEYQNHIYEKLMELYGSPHGALEEAHLADVATNAGELIEGLFGISIVAGGITALLSAALLIPVASNRANWRY